MKVVELVEPSSWTCGTSKTDIVWRSYGPRKFGKICINIGYFSENSFFGRNIPEATGILSNNRNSGRRVAARPATYGHVSGGVGFVSSSSSSLRWYLPWILTGEPRIGATVSGKIGKFAGDVSGHLRWWDHLGSLPFFPSNSSVVVVHGGTAYSDGIDDLKFWIQNLSTPIPATSSTIRTSR